MSIFPNNKVIDESEIYPDWVNIPACLNEREIKLQAFFKKSFGQQSLDSLLNSYGTLNKACHTIGSEQEMYEGLYSQIALPIIKSIKGQNTKKTRLVDAAGIDYEVIGLLSNEWFLRGSFNEQTNTYDNPYKTVGWGFELQTLLGQILTCNFMTFQKAMIILHGEDYVRNCVAYNREGERIDLVEAILESERFKREKNLFKSKIVKGGYKGNILSCTVDSASDSNKQQDVTNRWMPMFVNERIIFPYNTKFTNTARVKTKRIDAQWEHWEYSEVSKHELACQLALIAGKNYCKTKGHFTKNPTGELIIKIPETTTNEQENMNYLRLGSDVVKNQFYGPGDRIRPLTFYSQLEDINSETAKQINGLALYLYYVVGGKKKEWYEDCWNENKVGFYIIKNYRELIMTPELLWRDMNFQLPIKERTRKAGYLSSAAKPGTLKPGAEKPYNKDDYATLPTIDEDLINIPLNYSKFEVKGGRKGKPVETILTSFPTRFHKLYRCNNSRCFCYLSYDRYNHKWKPVKHLSYNHQFYKNSEKGESVRQEFIIQGSKAVSSNI